MTLGYCLAKFKVKKKIVTVGNVSTTHFVQIVFTKYKYIIVSICVWRYSLGLANRIQFHCINC